MTLHDQLERESEALVESYLSTGMEDVELLQAERRQSGSSKLLFSLLLEGIYLAAERRGLALTSKGLLKHYLKSEYKEQEDLVYFGGSTDEQDPRVIKAGRSIEFRKGIALRTLEALGWSRTLNAYIKHLMIEEREIAEEQHMASEEIRQFRDIDGVIDILFKEEDSDTKTKRIPLEGHSRWRKREAILLGKARALYKRCVCRDEDLNDKEIDALGDKVYDKMCEKCWERFREEERKLDGAS